MLRKFAIIAAGVIAVMTVQPVFAQMQDFGWAETESMNVVAFGRMDRGAAIEEAEAAMEAE